MDQRAQALDDALSTRILVLDGAMGTMIQQQHLTAADFGGAEHEGCNEHLVLTRPDVIRGFIGRTSKQERILSRRTRSTACVWCWRVRAGRQSIRDQPRRGDSRQQAADEFSGFVAGSMGPTTKTITVTGGVTFSQLIDNYYEQARGLVDGGADMLLIETAQDTRNVKAALLAIGRLEREIGRTIPKMVSGTYRTDGFDAGGANADALWTSVEHAGLLSIGLNCATGPEFMTDHIRTLHEWSRCASRAIPTRACLTRKAFIWRPRKRWPRSSSASRPTAGSTSSADAAAQRRHISAPSRRRWKKKRREP